MQKILTLLLMSFTLFAHTATMVYECDNNASFTASLENQILWLFLAKETLALKHVESGSGAKYTDTTTTLFMKGEEALLDYEQQSFTCKNNPSKAIWEKAKLDGYDFRAVGNEPGWSLVISKASRSIFSYNYASEEYIFTLPKPRETEDSAIYDINDSFSFTVSARVCKDDMSNQAFESSVTISFNKRTYKGCGFALH